MVCSRLSARMVGICACRHRRTLGAETAALLTPTMEGTSNVVGGILFIMTGLYQWSPLKDTCRGHCQAPLLFIQGHGGFRLNVSGALEIGVRHGAYCVG